MEMNVTSEIIQVPVGGEFSVRLESNPTTGYAWDVETLSEGVELLVGEYEKSAGEHPPGDPGIQAFRFRARKAGEYQINFILKRQWEKDAIKSHTVKVEVN
jgi:inhibitor of cysteine peptidase